MFVGVDGRFADGLGPSTVTGEFPGQPVVGEDDVEDLVEAGLELGGLDGDDRLDAAVPAREAA